MTISNQDARVTTLTVNSTLTYNFAFPVFDTDDLTVIIRNASTFVETLLADPADYSIGLTGSPLGATGGVVTLTAGPGDNNYISIILDPGRVQESSFLPTGPLDSNALETTLDKFLNLIKRVKDIADRSWSITEGSVFGDPAQSEWDANSQRITNLADPSLAQDAATKAYADSVDTANSVTDQAYADSQDAAQSVLDRTYTDDRDAVVSAANSVTDQAYADALDAANSITDQNYADSVAGLWNKNATGSKIINVAAPTLALDAANKAYVDGIDALNTVADQTYADTVALEGGVPGVSQAFHATASAVTTVNSVAGSVINFPVEVFDTGFSINLGVFTPNKIGYYLVTAEIINNLGLGATDVYEFTLRGQNPEIELASIDIRALDNAVAKQTFRLTAVGKATGLVESWYVLGRRVSGAGSFSVNGKFSGSFLHG